MTIWIKVLIYSLKKRSILAVLILLSAAGQAYSLNYPWLENYDIRDSLFMAIKTPQGFERAPADPSSFGSWLRNLPVKKDIATVYLYNGKPKRNQDAHHLIFDIDTGKKNLQQCADAVIRLISEYLYSVKAYEKISFKFTSGHTAEYLKWRQGYRPVVNGSRVKWEKNASEDESYGSFRKYLDTLFIYAGSYSLQKELEQVAEIKNMQPGDIFIQGGFPGHAVIVLDMAENAQTGKKLFLLAQSYMPAQDIHLLKNPSRSDISPWYDLDFGENLVTPEWTFSKESLRRFIFE